MPNAGKTSSRRAAAFTFPEVLVLVGVMALMAGLATQLLLSGHAFTARIETQQKGLQAALRMRVELGRWAQNVRPAPWDDPSKAFAQDGVELRIFEAPGSPHSQEWSLRVDGHQLVAKAGDIQTTWGPFDGLSVTWWAKKERVLGVVVNWTGGGENHRWYFAWGSLPL